MKDYIELHSIYDGEPMLFRKDSIVIIYNSEKNPTEGTTIYIDTDHYYRIKETYNEMKILLEGE